MVLIRSLIFTAIFYVFTALSVTWYFLLSFFLDRRKLINAIRHYMKRLHWLEKHIIGLDYEVRGLENLPKDNRFILASKHQSTYETMKLHLLFDDPAVVLKKELTEIPLWGNLAKKADQIPIDRSSREAAVKSMQEGAKRMIEQNRPIVIYPQGTRVKPGVSTQEKPYKFGIARMYQSAGLPVVPLALNTGVFWPRLSLIKKPGKVVFEFLPPIEAGLEQSELMKCLETSLEDASNRLIAEAQKAS